GMLEKDMLILELALKKKLNAYGPNHPDVLEIKDQLQLYRDKMARPGVTSGSTDNKVKALDSVEAVISALESEISADDALIKELDDMFETQQKMAREISNSELQDDRLRNQIHQNRQLLESITKRLSEINLVKDFGGYEARKISPATYAKKVAPNAVTV